MKRRYKVKLFLDGGLGNQLFQMNFYYYLIDRGYKVALVSFVGDNTLEKISLLTKEKYKVLKWPKIVFKVLKVSLKKSKLFYQENHGDYKEFSSSKYLYGFWHDMRYFDYDNNIAKKINSNHYQKEEDLISIHIRRGDYIENEAVKSKFNILGKNYYQKAINYVLSKGEFQKAYVFSDDIEWVKENYTFLKNYIDSVEFVDKSLKDYEALLLMANCSAHINANSTFSWWGSYLSDRKLVVMPKYWYKDKRLKNIKFKGVHYIE